MTLTIFYVKTKPNLFYDLYKEDPKNKKLDGYTNFKKIWSIIFTVWIL